MSGWALLPISLGTLYVGWQLMGLTFSALEGRCSCRKGGWNPFCVVHGRVQPTAEDVGQPAEGKRTSDAS